VYKLLFLSILLTFPQLVSDDKDSNAARQAMSANDATFGKDHFGNPDRFRRYIIRIPPIIA